MRQYLALDIASQGVSIAMRLRLIFSFVIIALVSIASVIVLARRGLLTRFMRLCFVAGMAGSEELVDALEVYYRDNQTCRVQNRSCYPPDTGCAGGQRTRV